MKFCYENDKMSPGVLAGGKMGKDTKYVMREVSVPWMHSAHASSWLPMPLPDEGEG